MKTCAEIVIALVVAVPVFGWCEDLVDFRTPVLVPAPVEMSYDPSFAVRLDSSVVFEMSCPDPAATWVREKAKKWFCIKNAMVKAVDGKVPAQMPDEGYLLKAEPGRITIGAKTFQGVRHALCTLRQAAEPIPEGRTISGWWLPKMAMTDAPKLKFRGVHICCFPETTPAFLERMIRIAAYYKFNYAVVESWGMFRSENLPFLSRAESWLTAAEAKRLAEIGRDLGITLIPQFNIFGHASGSTTGSAKHATLDFSPERSPLFEPCGGWNWCLTNPETRKVQIEYLSEMHEAFLRPPFVHIGCDEANAPSCARCRAAGPYHRLFADHVVAVAAAMRERGARVMMWHDMLLDHDDARWKGFYANGTGEMADILRTVFPRDIVVCDWYYGKVPEDGGYPTLRHFKEHGFDVLTCPWHDADGIAAQGRFAVETGICGMLATTWNVVSGKAFAEAMERTAAGAWGTEPPKAFKPRFGEPAIPSPFVTHWRQCGWDMGTPDYEETGFIRHQTSREQR